MLKITYFIILFNLCLATYANNISVIPPKVSDITNLQHQEKEFGFSVSPNPAQEYIDVIFTTDVTGILFIHDNLGNQVLDRDINNSLAETIYLHNFNSGIYFISVKTSSRTVIKRFIKY